MFTLIDPSKSYPRIKRVDIRDVRLYMTKFEESLKNLEAVQKENGRSPRR